jgi:hypothetical protein
VKSGHVRHELMDCQLPSAKVPAFSTISQVSS